MIVFCFAKLFDGWDTRYARVCCKKIKGVVKIYWFIFNLLSMSNGLCTVCRWVAPLILGVTALLLLLVNLGVEMGAFSDFVMKWWPAGILLYAVSGFFSFRGCCKD